MVTTGHIATNPRLVKEAIALTKEGIEVEIVFTQYMPYLVKDDYAIIHQYHWKHQVIVWTGQDVKSKLIKWCSAIIYKAAQFSFKYSKHPFILANCVNRNFIFEYGCAVNIKADIFIAHNLGALPVAYFAAKKRKARFGFDAEDFHRAESTDNRDSLLYQLTSLAEDAFLPFAAYITAASPLIAKVYQEIYLRNVASILNVFDPVVNKPPTSSSVKQLKLFWFSQTIGQGRGLEEIIEAINELGEQRIELHLLGKISNSDKIYFEQLCNWDYVFFYAPIPPDEVPIFAAQFDVGLALERKTPYNRDICLTNKVFTYLSAGIAVLLSNTQAQQNFYLENSKVGLIYDIGDMLSLIKALQHFSKHEFLFACKLKSAQLGVQQFNWLYESTKYISLIKSLN